MKKIFLILISLLGLVSCKSMPAKNGTALDRGKADLRNAIEKNKQIAINNLTLPDVVKNALKSNNQLDTAIIPGTKIAHPISRFNIVADKIPAKEFFLSLVDGTETNLLVHPEVSGDISLKLKNVTVPEVLEMVRKMYGYGFEQSPNGYQILAAKLQTRIFTVNYLDLIRDGKSDTRVNSSGLDSINDNPSNNNNNNNNANNNTSNTSNSDSSNITLNSRITTTSKADFWGQLKDTLTMLIANQNGSKISINPMAGMVIVQAMPDDLSKVEQYLKSSEEIMSRQVILEAKILEVELNDGYKAGINWALINKHLKVGQFSGDTNTGVLEPTQMPSGTGNILTPGPNLASNRMNDAPNIPVTAGQFGGVFTLGLNYHRLASFVELLSSQGNVQVLSSPRVSTLNNQKALIKVGEDEFFVTNVANTTTTAAGGTSSTPSVTFDPFFSGIALDVTPQIKDDGYITLHIHPTISSVTGSKKTVSTGTIGTVATEQSFDLAKSSVRESDNVVRAKNGQIIIIGGLMKDRTAEVITGLPMLKDMPFIGRLFRQTRQESKKSELVILLRPIVVDDNSLVSETEDTYARFDELDRGFHAGGTSNTYGNLAETKGKK